jgi:hypothetical protein
VGGASHSTLRCTAELWPATGIALGFVSDSFYAQPDVRGKPPLSATDVWICVAALTLTVLMGAVGAVGGLFSLAFLDYCPPESCSAGGAASAVLGSVLIAAIVGLAGLTATIVRLARRKPGWPFAIATFCTSAVVLFAGIVGYIVATGMANAPHR